MLIHLPSKWGCDLALEPSYQKCNAGGIWTELAAALNGFKADMKICAFKKEWILTKG